MAVPYNQDRPALFEELRFAKRQQWYVAASAVALNAAAIAATRNFKKLHWVAALAATVFVVGVAWGSVRLLWQLQRHLRSVRFALDPYDRDAATVALILPINWPLSCWPSPLGCFVFCGFPTCLKVRCPVGSLRTEAAEVSDVVRPRRRSMTWSACSPRSTALPRWHCARRARSSWPPKKPRRSRTSP